MTSKPAIKAVAQESQRTAAFHKSWAGFSDSYLTFR
jgi:hypothetical protein